MNGNAPRTRPKRRPPGWAHWALGAVAVLLVLVGLPIAWEAGSMAAIPDIGEPYGIAEFRRDFPNDVPDERNAFTYYRLALAAEAPSKQRVFTDVIPENGDPPKDWRHAGPELRARIEENREALDLWRRGTECDEAVNHRLEEMSVSTILDVSVELRNTFLTLALLEGSRLEEEGDMAGAWGWYRAIVRCSRHSGRHGFLIERLIGASMYRQAAERIERWAADPRVDVDLLRRAKRDLDKAEALRTPDEEMWKLECMIELAATRDEKQFRELIQYSNQQQGPTQRPVTAFGRILAGINPSRWMKEARVSSGWEAERTRRVLQLVWANRLPALSRPPEERPDPIVQEPMIYPNDPSAPEAARKIAPEELARRYKGLAIHAFSVEWLPRQIQAMKEEETARNHLHGEIDRQIQLRESP